MTFAYDPDDLDELTDEQIAALFDREHTPVELMLLAGYARPATAAPRQLDLYRGLETLPALDDYRPAESEIRR